MKWWREARFGMFIHWGIYSVPAGTYHGKQIPGIGEWIMHEARIPVKEYETYAKQFNPVKFDAEQWVLTAKNAGMKYIVITSKHHDGFAMFHSQVSKYNIYDATPFKRDPLKELAEACKKHDMKLGFYYSQAQDWHEPGGAGNLWDYGPTDEAKDFDGYIRDKAVPQVKEILSNYGPVAVLWWDTPVIMNRQRAEQFLPVLKLQPDIITNDRLGGGIHGDTSTPEQFIPANGYPDGRDWETCMTMNDTWGYKSYDNNWKTPTKLIRNLIDIASKGGNYLLNVGPTSEGEIPSQSIARLKDVGEWMKVNGESIYGTTASPFRRYKFDGRCTTKGNTLYVHVFTWPADGGVHLVGLKTPIKNATDLRTGESVRCIMAEKDVLIPMPPHADPYATVIKLELSGPPDVEAISNVIESVEDGSLRLRAEDATVVGDTARYESGNGLDNIGWWTNAKDVVKWDLNVQTAGKYNVDVTYACNDAFDGASYDVTASESKVSGTIESTGTWSTFKTKPIGQLDLPAGKQTLIVKPTAMPHGAVMNLKEVKLTPAK
jgi:alpha-L-fucosidase